MKVRTLEETTITTSVKGITVIGGESTPLKDTPTELLDIINEQNYAKVDGFIHGNTSARIIKDRVNKIEENRKNNEGNLFIHKYVREKGNDLIMENKNSMDTLFTELKTDMRERESRSRQEISDRESRFEKQLERFAKEAQDREERISQEAREREERIRREAKERDERVEKLITGISNKVDDHATYFETMKNQNFWGNVAVFGALVAILVALIIALVFN